MGTDLSARVLRSTARLSQRYPWVQYPFGEHANWRFDIPAQKAYLSDTYAIPHESKDKMGARPSSRRYFKTILRDMNRYFSKLDAEVERHFSCLVCGQRRHDDFCAFCIPAPPTLARGHKRHVQTVLGQVSAWNRFWRDFLEVWGLGQLGSKLLRSLLRKDSVWKFHMQATSKKSRPPSGNFCPNPSNF